MHLNIVMNSIWFLLPGLGIIAGAVVTALVLQTGWPLLFVLPGLMLAFRLERDPASVKFAELARHASCGIKRFHKQFSGVVGDFFVVGPFNMLTLDAVDSLLEMTDGTTADDASAPYSGLKGGSCPAWPAGMYVCRIADIDRITFTTNTGSFLITQGNEEVLQRFGHSSVRDAVLKTLRPAVDWTIEERFRKVFQLNVVTGAACLVFMFFTMALVFTIVGIVQANQLPLANWNDFRNMRRGGRGRGLLFLWVVLSEAFLFLINNVHPGLVLLLGITTTIAFGIMLYAAQWTRVADTTWSNPNSRIQ